MLVEERSESVKNRRDRTCFHILTFFSTIDVKKKKKAVVCENALFMENGILLFNFYLSGILLDLKKSLGKKKEEGTKLLLKDLHNQLLFPILIMYLTFSL